MGHRVPADQFIELNVPANTALLWRTQVWHCVTPNLSNTVRKVFYVGYHYRWLRPTDYIQQDAELVARLQPAHSTSPSLDENPVGGFGGTRLLTMVPLASPAEDWALTEDQTRLYAALPAAGEVAVIDTSSWTVARHIPIPGAARCIAARASTWSAERCRPSATCRLKPP